MMAITDENPGFARSTGANPKGEGTNLLSDNFSQKPHEN